MLQTVIRCPGPESQAMRYGPLVFVGLLFALALSWLGMIATPQFQLGAQQPTNVPPANVQYPTPYPGVASLGREVYRANGCAYCHSQAVRQDGNRFDLVMTNSGTNEMAVIQALVSLGREFTAEKAQKVVTSLPATIMTESRKEVVETTLKSLTDAGAEAAVRMTAIGPDISRGWGPRLSVARDYVYDFPLMLGSARIGPDLKNVGIRQPDETWHLVHLYDPKLRVQGSIMPRYPFLFEKRPRGRKPSPDALPIPGDYEIIPTREARALAAYLVSLRAELPLFEAPAPPVTPAKPSAGATNQAGAAGAVTNQPAADGTTNAPATNQAAPQ